MRHVTALALAATLATTAALRADPAEIVSARIDMQTTGARIDVTLRHGDTGWDDYADGWRVELADGTILGTRALLHPHVEEQPFTRSLSNVAIPAGTAQVFIRARTNVDGWGEARLALDLPG